MQAIERDLKRMEQSFVRRKYETEGGEEVLAWDDKKQEEKQQFY
jgi:hypothetical protein